MALPFTSGLSNSSALFGDSGQGGVKVTFNPIKPLIGTITTAAIGDGLTGKIQFTKTTTLGVKSNVGAVSASGVTSHTYTPVSADAGQTLGADLTELATSVSTNKVLV